MKKRLLSSIFLLSSLVSQAQHEYTIKGEVKGVKDGTPASLFLTDGRVGSVVATDTIRNGTFFFKRNAGESGLDHLSLMCHSADFPPMALDIYAIPDAQIKITGANSLIYTWKVDSPAKEQQEHNRFIEDSRDLWDEFQRLAVKEDGMRSASEAELNAIRTKTDSILAIISQRELNLMKEVAITNVWMEKLLRLSMSLKYNPKFTHREEILALYDRLNEKQKASIEAQEIKVNLFPPKTVKEGDDMADADLYDLNGKIHHLADFKGKYILLDFWSSGCGPCIMALPEMKELQEQYKDRLTIISLSSDTQSRWKAASAQHEMTWQNLSDLKQCAGLYAVYDVNGIPNYVLISPEGKIMKMWSGYGEGSLKLKIRRYLDAAKREMSITQDANKKIVNHPKFESTNTDILEVKQVELTDTATIVHFYAYYIPKYWIRVSKNAQLVDEMGASYTLQKADGITPGEHFFLPESGEAEFSLTFKPLPLETKLFNFTEGTAQNDWQINGIKLSK